MTNDTTYPDTKNKSPLSAEDFLEHPEELKATLERFGALTFTPYASGLFPASSLPAGIAKATGMGMAWLRDNAHVANALYETGHQDLAISAGKAILAILNNNRDTLDGIVNGTYNPTDHAHRLTVRVQGDTLESDAEPRVQNDAVGYALWLTSKFIADGAIKANEEDMETLAQTVRYLDKIQYWQDPDDGHWEEDRRVHVSSIGVVVAGLRAAKQMFNHATHHRGIDFDALITRGRESILAILSQGMTDVATLQEVTEGQSPGGSHHRKHDAALLFLIEPLHALDGMPTHMIVGDIERNLVRQHGVTRYEGDTYWEPHFKDIMTIEERTSAAIGRIEKRNEKAVAVAYSKMEAQWTLFDPLLSVYWGERYQEAHDPEAREKQLNYLNRSLTQLVSTTDGKLLLPEAYYYDETKLPDGSKGNAWVPNDHMPLLWAQANLLLALKMFEQTT